MMASWPNGKAFDFDFRLSGYMVSKDCRFDPGGGQSIINFLFLFLVRNLVCTIAGWFTTSLVISFCFFIYLFVGL